MMKKANSLHGKTKPERMKCYEGSTRPDGSDLGSILEGVGHVAARERETTPLRDTSYVSVEIAPDASLAQTLDACQTKKNKP
jgi:hypothetical protein